jgi:hypothetical protein
MTVYPAGVIQNSEAPHNPVKVKPVDKDNWCWFGRQADADSIYQLIAPDLWKPKLVAPTTGMYSQYIYLPPSNVDMVRPWLIAGGASDADGIMFIEEFAGWLFDRNSDPLEGIDTYVAGEAHVLKIRRITETLGQCYWAAA